MKTFIFSLIAISVFLNLNTLVQAQVTIGSGIPPHKGALLDIKEKETTGSELNNSTKGILYPRVPLIHPDSLAPIVVAPTSDERIQATGMMVFNTSAINDKNLKLGVYMWNGTQWILAVDGTSSMRFDSISISEIIINGEYTKDKTLDSKNTITVSVNVTVPGKYEAYAETYPDNGYYFIGSGTLYNTGSQTIVLQGYGKPGESTKNRNNILDDIRIRINSSPIVTVTNKVLDVAAQYSMNCLNIRAQGTYKPNVKLTNNNYITVPINTPVGSAGGEYKIQTDVINGYSFIGTGVLNGGEQTIYLNPTSLDMAPLKAGANYFTLSSNSITSSNTCNFEINIIADPIHIFSAGSSAIYSPFGITSPGYIIATNQSFFGPSGTYKNIEGFKVDQSILGTDASLTSALNTISNDIVFSAYNARITVAANNISAAVNMINSGRVFIQATDGPADTSVNADTEGRANGVVQLLLQIFDGLKLSDIEWRRSFADNTNCIFTNADSPLIKGPFGGNLYGAQLAVDGGYNFGFKVNHPDFVGIAVQGDGNGYYRVFCHRTKGYLFIGDGGAWSTLSTNTNMTLFLKNILAWAADIRINND